MNPFPSSRRTLLLLLLVATVVTMVDAVKPLHIDDPFIYRIAEQIAREPTDPYGFDIFWLQWPQPVVEELTPPVLPYWWSLALTVAPEREWVWKLSMFPFVLLLCGAVCALARRFAPGAEIPTLLLFALSPAILPSVNMMQDVPALALGLTALVAFLRGTDDEDGMRWVVAAGLIGGLAAQTKYTAVAAWGAMGLWSLLERRRFRKGAVAIGLALAVFFGWEAVLWARYGHSMFFGQVRHGLYWFERSSMVLPLLRLLGATLPAVLLVLLAALRMTQRVLASVAVLLLASFGLLTLAPFQGALFLTLGIGLLVALIVTLALTLRQGAYPEPDRFLLGWLSIEVAVFFLAAPFPAVRRILGLALVLTLMAVRRLVLARSDAPDPGVWRWPLAVGLILGLLFAGTDHREALAQRDAVSEALALIRERDARPTVWFVGHWGFQHYAEAAGMRPVIPDVSRLREGDWLLVPSPVHRQDIDLRRADVESPLVLDADRIPPLTTGLGFYGGSLPLAHLAGPRLRTEIFRVRRDTVPRTSWSPAQLADWARMAGGRTAAAALPALVHALETASSVGRRQAIEGLAALGARAEPAREVLLRASRDSDADVRAAAEAALAAIAADAHPSAH